ncbi:hypothetical protein A0256_13540 [Mucilaginibacter sp. PAMC 26640]|nr:hypothetical protein A0256_13540 [Mucilaginibacter sp. PAMC 26640]
MNEPFILAVKHQGIEHEFKARFERWGYTHRIAVLINDDSFVFEPDEECGYRALMADKASTLPLDNALLRSVAEKLTSLNN